MDIIPLTSFNGSTSISCLAMAVPFYLQKYGMPNAWFWNKCSRSMSCLCLGLQFNSKKYGMLIAWLLDSGYSASGILKHV